MIIAALFIASGGHWAVLQMVAWGRMMVEYSQRSEIAVAVAKTFDGRHPCSMCVAIQKSRQSEKKQEMQITAKKMEIFCQAAQLFVFAEADCGPRGMEDSVASPRFEQPSAPPPRFA